MSAREATTALGRLLDPLEQHELERFPCGDRPTLSQRCGGALFVESLDH